MQTFLPSANYTLCAITLDDRRLRKQVVEGLQMLQYLVTPTLSKLTVSQRHHPVFGYWPLGSEGWLLQYTTTCITELQQRSATYKVPDLYLMLTKLVPPLVARFKPMHPTAVHFSHACALVHKDYAYYHSGLPMALPILNYIWHNPTTNTYYTGRLSDPKSVHDLGPWPLADEWRRDCERRGLMKFPH